MPKPTLLSSLLFALLAAPAMPQSLVEDIRPGGGAIANGGAGPVAVSGLGFAFFTVAPARLPGTSRAYPTELWKTDGTASGTVRVCPWTAGPIASGLEVGSRLLLTTEDGELWSTDGTAAGTCRLGTGVPPRYLTRSRQPGEALFSAEVVSWPLGLGPVVRQELLRTDGTIAGTSILTSSSEVDTRTLPEPFQFVTLYAGQSASTGSELAQSNGTVSGTYIIVDTLTGPAGLEPTELCAGVQYCYFRDPAGNVYSVDSSQLLATSRLANRNARSFATLGDTLFCAADDPVNGRELHTVKATSPSNTNVLAIDVRVGADGSEPAMLGSLQSLMLFRARMSSSGPYPYHLYSSDGTGAGTVSVLAHQPDEAFARWLQHGETPATLPGGDWLVVLRDHETDRPALFRVDGTPSGTSRVWLPPAGSTAQYGTSITIGSSVMFFVEEPDGIHPWISDGTSGGTQRISKVGTSIAASSSPRGGVALGDGEILFFADDGTHGLEPWYSDGTAAGTILLRDLDGAPTSSVAEPANGRPAAVVLGGQAFFVGSDGTAQRLWRSDGTPAGTMTVGTMEVMPGSLAGDTRAGKLYFYGRDLATGYEPWIMDSVGATPRRIADLRSGPADSVRSDLPPFVNEFNGSVLFAADDGSGTGFEPWNTDGTAMGTTLIQDLLPGPGSSEPVGIAVASPILSGGEAGERTVFVTRNPSTVSRAPFTWSDIHLLSVIEGRSDSIALVADVDPRIGHPDDYEYVPRRADGVWARRLSDGRVLFWDGVGDDFPGLLDAGSGDLDPLAWAVSPAPPNPPSSQDSLRSWLRGELLFSVELTDSLGTSIGTSLGGTRTDSGPSDIAGLSGPGKPVEFGEVEPWGDSPYAAFVATANTSGRELWFVDGLLANAFPAYSVIAGVESSDPHELVRAGGTLFFSARDGATGYELHAIPVSFLGGSVVETIASGGPGSSGIVPSMGTIGVPFLGNAQFGLELQNAPTGAPAVAMVGVDTVETPLAPGCSIWLSLPAVQAGVTVVNQTGTGAVALPLPSDQSLIGVQVYTQFWVFDPGACALNLAAPSDALRLILNF